MLHSIACVVEMKLSHNQIIHYKIRAVLWRKHRKVCAWFRASAAM